MADYNGTFQIDAGTCNLWVSKNSVAGRPVLRDLTGAASIEKTLGLALQDVMILDRQLKIVFRGHVADTLQQNQVLTLLGSLK
jgi:hypothetical protein